MELTVEIATTLDQLIDIIKHYADDIRFGCLSYGIKINTNKGHAEHD